MSAYGVSSAAATSSSLNISKQPSLDFTFRDPAGQLCLSHSHALRRIHRDAVDETMAFLNSPLRTALESSGDLIPTEILNTAAAESASREDLWLQHPRVDPISYPWEWTTLQWRAAAELTLKITQQAINAGWTLKDATPLNILFVGTRPVLVDVLSFERRDLNSSVWLAYGQFVRTFLLPLVAEKLLHWPLQSCIFSRDGYEPSAIYRALRPWQRLYPSLLDVVTLATHLDSSTSSAPKPKARKRQVSSDPELAAHILHKRLSRLTKQIHLAAHPERHSHWSNYPQSATHYTVHATESKQQFVRTVLQRFKPERVLDIGANTGTYSLIAAESGSQVIALDSDSAAIETLWIEMAKGGSHQAESVTTLVANIARPTPAVGWRNREQLSLLERLTGNSDMVFLLAVIHHLILREQMPLPHIADLCASLTSRLVLLEWVPASDPMFQEWLRGRENLYGHLSESDLHHAFGVYFTMIDRCVLPNDRVLLLFELNLADHAPTGAHSA